MCNTNGTQLNISLIWRRTLAAALLACGLAVAPASAQCVTLPHTGNWVNVNAATRGITRAVIEFTCVDVVTSGRPRPPSWHVTLFGKCHPTDCPWGRVAGTESGTINTLTITARYNQGFARRVVTITHTAATDRLNIRVATNFTNPGRTDYTATYTMRRP